MDRPLVRPSRRLSQNFLVDDGVLARILAAFAPDAGDLVLEIGPGHGVLTAPVGERVRRLVAVELDSRLAVPLAARLAGVPQISVLQGDALRLDWGSLYPDGVGPGLRVLANLPYSISSPTVLRLLEDDTAREAHLMLQREYVDRLTAKAGTKAYGSLTVLVAARARVTRLFDVPPAAFRPRPSVGSSFVRLDLARPRALDEGTWSALKRVTRAAFDGRRKRLSNSLTRGLGMGRERVEKMVAAAGVDGGARADGVEAEGYVRMARALVGMEGEG